MTAIVMTYHGRPMGHEECLFYGITFLLMFIPILLLVGTALFSFLRSKRTDIQAKLVGFCLGFPVFVFFAFMVIFGILNIIYGLS